MRLIAWAKPEASEIVDHLWFHAMKTLNSLCIAVKDSLMNWPNWDDSLAALSDDKQTMSEQSDQCRWSFRKDITSRLNMMRVIEKELGWWLIRFLMLFILQTTNIQQSTILDCLLVHRIILCTHSGFDTATVSHWLNLLILVDSGWLIWFPYFAMLFNYFTSGTPSKAHRTAASEEADQWGTEDRAGLTDADEYEIVYAPQVFLDPPGVQDEAQEDKISFGQSALMPCRLSFDDNSLTTPPSFKSRFSLTKKLRSLFNRKKSLQSGSGVTPASHHQQQISLHDLVGSTDQLPSSPPRSKITLESLQSPAVYRTASVAHDLATSAFRTHQSKVDFLAQSMYLPVFEVPCTHVRMFDEIDHDDDHEVEVKKSLSDNIWTRFRGKVASRRSSQFTQFIDLSDNHLESM